MTDEVEAPLRRARLLAAGWGCFLLAVTSWPRPPRIPAGGLPLDAMTHFFLYAVEGFLLYRGIRWPGNAGTTFGRVAAITGALAVWGMIDEVHQEWIPGRTMESIDVATDVAGAAAGAAAAGISAGRPPSRRLRRSGPADSAPGSARSAA